MPCCTGVLQHLLCRHHSEYKIGCTAAGCRGRRRCLLVSQQRRLVVARYRWACEKCVAKAFRKADGERARGWDDKVRRINQDETLSKEMKRFMTQAARAQEQYEDVKTLDVHMQQLDEVQKVGEWAYEYGLAVFEALYPLLPWGGGSGGGSGGDDDADKSSAGDDDADSDVDADDDVDDAAAAAAHSGEGPMDVADSDETMDVDSDESRAGRGAAREAQLQPPRAPGAARAIRRLEPGPVSEDDRELLCDLVRTKPRDVEIARDATGTAAMEASRAQQQQQQQRRRHPSPRAMLPPGTLYVDAERRRPVDTRQLLRRMDLFLAR
ncbi:uncharacterized protein UV8b_06866 [Ustilaginoidea virens]|uniref:Uncharacterized protein n=1 Tax=Ustilaginoidea virens TaxID=1159556 RepID=A0A063CC47_USTVR|nr:uncharacterized protein UV8b_06866 [Ustilaginoidea virens]QUC22625.1 hypothetical protein UV8b_06866 [Ustilaginoidea virens]GAO16868.1 hypothetical protein UVI_02011890 [Ustilaginoidea virens]